jgi:hypothetical protein
MKSVLIISVIIVLIIFSIQFYAYKKTSKKIEIGQSDYKKLINNERKIENENIPLIITNFVAVEPYKQLKNIGIISPLSIYENLYDYLISDDTTYYSHNYEVLGILTDKIVEIELINPIYKKKFDYLDKYDSIYQWSLNDLNQNEIKSIGIKLYPNQILIIPRFWLYRVENSEASIKVQVSHTIFSYLFSFLN